jgi:tRNA pseudouridine55 synthase
MPRDGFLNLLKPPGMTSHDAVTFLRSRLRMRRIGHLGTLDPAAAGVLPIAIGRATRLLDYTAGLTKAYRAEITFGATTDTLDADGSATAWGDAGALARPQLLDLLTRFIGDIQQTPPAHSAVQVDGQRLHKLARRGETPAVRPRTVRIDSIDLVGFWPGRRARALMDVVCGAGTYIRSLAADLGELVGCGAYLGFLVRTRAGRFELSDALTLEECQAAFERGELPGLILPPDWPLAHLPEVSLEAAASPRFSQGTPMPIEAPDAESVRVYSPRGTGVSPVDESAARRFLGIAAVREGRLRPRVVLSGPGEGEE